MTTKKVYHAIPGMSDITADEFVKYVDVIGLEAVRSSSEKSLTDIITFWKAHQSKCHDCQDWQKCGFLQLQLTQLTRLAPETLRMLEFLSWNLNV